MNDNENNLDETKVFKTNDSSPEELDETLNIPFTNRKTISIEDTINLSEEELIDEGLSNIKAAEDEINQVLEVQNGDNGDNNMAKKKKNKLSYCSKNNI